MKNIWAAYNQTGMCYSFIFWILLWFLSIFSFISETESLIKKKNAKKYLPTIFAGRYFYLFFGRFSMANSQHWITTWLNEMSFSAAILLIFSIKVSGIRIVRLELVGFLIINSISVAPYNKYSIQILIYYFI